jgi:hypothetical protein
VTRIYDLWRRRLDGTPDAPPVLTRGLIREIHTTILARAEDSLGGRRSNMTPGEAHAVLDRVEFVKPAITAEHTEFGLHWLRTTGPRRGLHPDLAATLVTFREFRLAGVAADDGPRYRVAGVPLWEVRTGAGTWTYSVGPWQRGLGRSHAYSLDVDGGTTRFCGHCRAPITGPINAECMYRCPSCWVMAEPEDLEGLTGLDRADRDYYASLDA